MVVPEMRKEVQQKTPAWLVKRANEDKAKLEPGGLAKTLQKIMQQAPETAQSAKVGQPTIDEQRNISYPEPVSDVQGEAMNISPSPSQCPPGTLPSASGSPQVEGARDLLSPSRGLFIPENQIDASLPQSLVPGVQMHRYEARPLPKWYTAMKDTSFEMKELNKKRPQALASLESLKACINQWETYKHKQSERTRLYEELRDLVHKAEITLHVNKYIVKQSRILSETGLPRIFTNPKFPGDLKADAYQLYNRWYEENFEQDILRGILTVKGRDRNGDQLCKVYKAKYPTTAKVYGENGLVLGQWWPTQLCTVRDGAHGSSQGGIFGEKGKGAYSIVLSGGSGYHDVDDGDVIEYSGTEGKNSTPTENTQHLIKSAELGNNIRVIRSAQLAKKNPYRPELGLRYDGLYTVKGYRLVDKEKAMYQFRLERCLGQGSIRYKNNAARRPTVFEVREFNRLREKVW